MMGADLRPRASLDPRPEGPEAEAGAGRADEPAGGLLRVAMVAPVALPVPPPGYGGTERVVSVLTEELVARGHDVTLFGVEGSRSAAHLTCTLADPPHPDDPGGAIDELAHALHAYLRAGEFDLIHDHSTVGTALGAVLPAPPVVHTLHGPWTARARRLLEPIAHRVGLVAISRAQADANPVPPYLGVVHNGLDVTTHPYRAAKDDHLVFIGRINPQKGVVTAVHVAHRAGRPLKIISKRREQAEWEYWESAVAPLLSREDEVYEQPPEAVKLDVLARACATLFPIDWPEPFGLVMIESMACGTPVIARPAGAAPEVVVDGVTGFLRDTIDELAAAVDRVGELDPAACRARVESCFSATSMTDGYEAMYRRAIASARGRAPAGGSS